MSRWSVPLNALAKRHQARLETVVRKATFELFRSVVLKSPVDTGRFRANWNVSYGTPNFNVTPSKDQQRGTNEASKALSMKVGSVMYLSNGLPYARRLEYGHSRQAPAGMVRISVAEFNDMIQRALQ